MKKYYIAILLILALTVYWGKMIYDAHYIDIPPYDRPDTIITRVMEGMIWNFNDYRDRYVQKWMEENIRDAQKYQCELVIRTAGAPDPIQHFLIRVSATDEAMAIEDMQTGEITYFQVSDNEVFYYYPKDGTYTVKTFEGADTAEAFSDLFFPSDLRFLGKSTYNTYDNRSRGGRILYIVPRQIDIRTFYAPFIAIKDDSVFDNVDYYAEFNDHRNFDDLDKFAFKITFLNDMSDFLTYAYEALNGEGSYDLSDSSYVQIMSIFFYDDMHDVEDITIPHIE